jgi:hypothetical protein
LARRAALCSSSSSKSFTLCSRASIALSCSRSLLLSSSTSSFDAGVAGEASPSTREGSQVARMDFTPSFEASKVEEGPRGSPSSWATLRGVEGDSVVVVGSLGRDKAGKGSCGAFCHLLGVDFVCQGFGEGLTSSIISLRRGIGSVIVAAGGFDHVTSCS